eukprot:scaffold17307_cov63-Phaeocystis_antarctica.AAC.7
MVCRPARHCVCACERYVREHSRCTQPRYPTMHGANLSWSPLLHSSLTLTLAARTERPQALERRQPERR